MRRLVIAALVLAAAGIAAFAVLRPQHPEKAVRAALDAQVAGVDSKDASYPRMGVAMRSRAWVLAGPSQPDGTALFTSLPDVQFGRERSVLLSDLRASLRRIRGLAWNPVIQSWTDGSRTVPFAEVRELLSAAAPTPSDAAGVLDLLTGTPAPGLPELAPLLQADPPRIIAIHIVPFQGICGRMLLDRGRAPYVPVDRAYKGLLARLDGQDMPQGWRVLSLRVIDR